MAASSDASKCEYKFVGTNVALTMVNSSLCNYQIRSRAFQVFLKLIRNMLSRASIIQRAAKNEGYPDIMPF
jgi:hypothetical protein